MPVTVFLGAGEGLSFRVEASALTHAGRSGLLGRSPLLRLKGDDRLVAMIRDGQVGAFEVLFERYQARLLGFCRHMLRSQQDAEDVLQEVFVAAYNAMLADDREINVRPWLYRIARNRCLNHLRRPVPDGQDSMDVHPHENGTTTHDRVQSREDLRDLVSDIGELPETQRTALLLREIDALSYDDIAEAMDTTIPSVKSLLVRARISLAEAGQARQLTCAEVRVELAEAAAGVARASGPVRRHARTCEQCGEFRSQLRSDNKALAALFPIGPALALKALAAKLGLANASGGGAAGAAGGGSAVSGAAGGAGGAAGISGTTAGIGGTIGGALGVKAAAGVATAVLVAAGAVEVKQVTAPTHDSAQPVAQAQYAPAVAPKIGSSLSVKHIARTAEKATPAAALATVEPGPATATNPAPAPPAAQSNPPQSSGQAPPPAGGQPSDTGTTDSAGGSTDSGPTIGDSVSTDTTGDTTGGSGSGSTTTDPGYDTNPSGDTGGDTAPPPAS